MLKTLGRKWSLLASGNVWGIEEHAKEDSVYIYGLVRFVTGGEEAKKNHEAVKADIFNAADRKFKEIKARDPHFLSFLTRL